MARCFLRVEVALLLVFVDLAAVKTVMARRLLVENVDRGLMANVVAGRVLDLDVISFEVELSLAELVVVLMLLVVVEALLMLASPLLTTPPAGITGTLLGSQPGANPRPA